MKIYYYDKETKEFIKEGLAYIDLNKSREANVAVYAIPEFATDLEPPKVSENQKQVFMNNEWLVCDDFRKQKFFDTETKKKVIVTKLGELPSTYVTLDSEEYKNFLNRNDINFIKNGIKTLIENLYKQSFDKEIFIGKHSINLLNFDKYINLKEQVETQIQKINDKFNENQKLMNANRNDIELYNKLAEENLLLYKELDLIRINLMVKNKRNREIELPCNYDEFIIIFNELQRQVDILTAQRDNALNKLKFIDKQENLLIYEINLLEKGLCTNNK